MTEKAKNARNAGKFTLNKKSTSTIVRMPGAKGEAVSISVPLLRSKRLWTSIFSIKTINHVPDRMGLIHLIRDGVPGEAISLFAKEVNVSKTEVYNLLHMNPRTAQRAASRKLDVEKSDHLVQIAKVYQRTLEVFEDDDKAMCWLKTPNYALGNQKPWELLDTTEGIELIQDTLGRIEHGVFA